MKCAKRIFDLFVASIGLICLVPIFILLGYLIKREDKGPILFIQERVGYKGKPFKLFKFRTMVTGAEKMGPQLTVGTDNRITRVGRFLRKYKLDELPQLINVIKGDMSLVGPRPEVPYFVNKYNETQKKVLNIIPGITDPASIMFLDESEHLKDAADPEKEYIENIMPQKIEVYLSYAEKTNIGVDFIIILRTIYATFCKRLIK